MTNSLRFTTVALAAIGFSLGPGCTATQEVSDIRDAPNTGVDVDAGECVVARVAEFPVRISHVRTLALSQHPPLDVGRARRLAVDAALAACERDCAKFRAGGAPVLSWLDDYRWLRAKFDNVGKGREQKLVEELARLAQLHGAVAGPCAADRQTAAVL